MKTVRALDKVFEFYCSLAVNIKNFLMCNAVKVFFIRTWKAYYYYVRWMRNLRPYIVWVCHWKNGPEKFGPGRPNIQCEIWSDWTRFSSRNCPGPENLV